MNIDNLMNNLEYALTQATKKIQLPTKNGVYVAPKIARGYLPPKDPKKEADDVPCVIIRLLGDDTDDDGTIAKVKIVCVAYSEDDEQGWRELLTIMDPVQTYVLTHRNIGGSYRIAMPIKRDIPEEQGPPEWVGTITLPIEIPTVEEVNEDVRGFLAGHE